MSKRLENYIGQVLEHYHGDSSEYKGMIYSWDVVNEAVNDSDGELRTDSSWYRYMAIIVLSQRPLFMPISMHC